MGSKKPEVIVVGTGNLAWHLVPNLQAIGLSVQLWSRQPAAVQVTGWPVSARGWPGQIDNLPKAVFLAVPDDAIADTSTALAALFPPEVPLIHTSGATAETKITNHFIHRGVLWPIRSFKLGQATISWREVPLVYSSTSPQLREQLNDWATAMSQEAVLLDEAQRSRLHLAAVFSNNFTNWLCQIAYELCAEKDIPFRSLVPIIQQTFADLPDAPPALRQTGAAIRGDEQTMARHLRLLSNRPNYAELYGTLSELIGRYRDAEQQATTPPATQQPAE